MAIDNLDKQLLDIIRGVFPRQLSDEEVMGCQDFLTLGFDSIMIMRLVLACEEIFDMEFSDDDLSLDILGHYRNLKETMQKHIGSG